MLGIQYAQSPALGVDASRHPRLETEPRDLAAVRSYYRSVRKVSKLRVDFSSGIVFLVVAESHSLFLHPHRKSFLFPCRHNESTRRLQEIEKKFNTRVLQVRSLCAFLFYNVLKKALISYVYPLSFGETAFLMKIDHENSLADIASISVALRTDSVKVVCPLESNWSVVTQERNHCGQFLPYVRRPNFQQTLLS